MSDFEEFARSQGFSGDFQRGCNGQYKSDLLHFMEKSFAHQQAKIDELKKTRSLDEMAINQLAQANQVWRTKCDDLENRIHDAELQIAVHWGADEDTDSVLRDVEKALRGASD